MALSGRESRVAGQPPDREPRSKDPFPVEQDRDGFDFTVVRDVVTPPPEYLIVLRIQASISRYGARSATVGISMFPCMGLF